MGESTFKLLWVVGRIQFLEAVGLKFPFPCLLLVRNLSQFLKVPAFPITLHLHLQTSKLKSSPPHTLNLSDFLFCQALLPPTSRHLSEFSWKRFLLLRGPVIRLDPPAQPRLFPISKSITLITFTKSSLPCKVTDSQVRMWAPWG